MSNRLILVPLRPEIPSEREWLQHLLAKFDLEVLDYSETPPVIPGALYLFNSLERLQIDPSLLSAIEKTEGCGLLHAGDEYFRGGYDQYSAFDYVVRSFPIDHVSGPGVFDIPVGPTSDMGPPDVSRASDRPYNYVFAGNWKADRSRMARIFSKIPEGFVSIPRSFFGERGISRAEYLKKMSSTKFAPCPAGNICLETCRPYEALHFGAIPLLPKRQSADIYREMLGDHPLPTFFTWREALSFVEQHLADPDKMNALQSECIDWWNEFKLSKRDELFAFVQQGRAGTFKNEIQARFAGKDISIGARYRHIIRQQNKDQLVDRLQMASRRALHRLRGGRRLEGQWTYSLEKQRQPSGPDSSAKPKIDA